MHYTTCVTVTPCSVLLGNFTSNVRCSITAVKYWDPTLIKRMKLYIINYAPLCALPAHPTTFPTIIRWFLIQIAYNIRMLLKLIQLCQLMRAPSWRAQAPSWRAQSTRPVEGLAALIKLCELMGGVMRHRSHSFISFNNIYNIVRCFYGKSPHNNKKCGWRLPSCWRCDALMPHWFAQLYQF